MLSDDNLVLSKLKFGSWKVFQGNGSLATCDVTEEDFNFPGKKSLTPAFSKETLRKMNQMKGMVLRRVSSPLEIKSLS